MSLQNELQSLGFVHAGAIRPVDSGRSCRANIGLEIDGLLVYAHVVGDQVKKFGTTAPTIRGRMQQNASTINGVLRLADGRCSVGARWHRRPFDAFKSLAPEVIRSNQQIDWWVIRSSASEFKNLERQLNASYDTIRNGWATRLG